MEVVHIWFECFPTLVQGFGLVLSLKLNMTALQAKTMGLDAAGLFRTTPSASGEQLSVKSGFLFDF